jgi:hypothetical protein
MRVKGGIVHGDALLAFADDLGGTVAGLNISEGFRPRCSRRSGLVTGRLLRDRRPKGTFSQFPDLRRL